MRVRAEGFARWGIYVVSVLLPWAGLVLALSVRDAGAYTAKGVGVVTALRGQAAVAHVPEVAARERRPAQEPLRFRSDVFFRDVIDTQRDTTAKVLLNGQSTLTIRELSRVELQEGVVPAAPARTRSIVSLLAGAFRAITAPALMRGDEMEIRTPNAIAAIRGTDIVVEVYRDAAPPPLPPEASVEPTIQPASFEVAQAPVGVVTRLFVISGLLGVEGLTAGALQGIEKVGNLPPRLFRFTPDLVNNLVARFAIAVVTGPLGAHQARTVAANQGRAAGEAAPAAPTAQFQPGQMPLVIERAVNSVSGPQARDILRPRQPLQAPSGGCDC